MVSGFGAGRPMSEYEGCDAVGWGGDAHSGSKVSMTVGKFCNAYKPKSQQLGLDLERVALSTST